MNEKLKPHNEISTIREDTLTRLEWKKITESLSHFATFSHTKESLKTLSPWNEAHFFQKATEELFSFLSSGIHLSLKDFKLDSFEKILGRGGLISPYGLYQIYTVMVLSQSLQSFAKSHDMIEKNYPKLFGIFQGLRPQPTLCQRLAKSVDEEGNILPNASEELYAAHKRYASAKKRITENLDQILKSNTIKNAVQDSTWMFKEGRYVLPVRTDRKNDVEGIPRGVSQTGSTIFIEPKILAQDQAALEKAQVDIELEEHKIIKSLSEECAGHSDSITQSVESLTLIDEIYARYQFAKTIEGIPCQLQETMEAESFLPFSFHQAKHPLFLLEQKPCIPNHMELSNANVLVLSGPNAGGKTVVLKTIGVLVLMAKCGLFLPCETAKCQNFEKIFVLIGDNQNREEDLSTFSGHLDKVKKILAHCDDKTLILLDEGFVGTDPAVGVALARAVLEAFAEKKSTVVITTHFSSLKTLASEDPRFYNASMEFESKNLRPTYKLLNGIPGQSFALELCERMGIERHIISEARRYYGDDAQRMENILQDLQQQKRDVEEELYEQKQLSQKIKDELEAIQKEQKSLLEIKESLVEGYRSKLVKRMNAFQNRLEIRERQFQKQKENLLTEIQENKPQEPIVPHEEPVYKNILPIIDEKKDNQPARKNKMTSFEELAKLKIDTSNSKKSYFADDQYRQPKQMTHRSLIDEAQESLDVMHKSFDRIDEDLDDELSEVLNLNKSTKQKAQQIKDKIQPPPAPQRPATYWKKGMPVKTLRFQQSGFVLKEADNKGQVECQFGPLKSKIDYRELLLPTQASPMKKTPQQIREKLNSRRPVKNKNAINGDIPQVLPHKGNTIDLRGDTVDVAISKMDLDLDKMWRSEVSQVVILHGHGLGKIKEAVRKYLESSSYELTYRPGRHGEGGDGVTIVEFEN